MRTLGDLDLKTRGGKLFIMGNHEEKGWIGGFLVPRRVTVRIIGKPKEQQNEKTDRSMSNIRLFALGKKRGCMVGGKKGHTSASIEQCVGWYSYWKREGTEFYVGVLWRRTCSHAHFS